MSGLGPTVGPPPDRNVITNGVIIPDLLDMQVRRFGSTGAVTGVGQAAGARRGSSEGDRACAGRDMGLRGWQPRRRAVPDQGRVARQAPRAGGEGVTDNLNALDAGDLLQVAIMRCFQTTCGPPPLTEENVRELAEKYPEINWLEWCGITAHESAREGK